MPKRIQAVITTYGGVTKCKMTCQIFAGNEISFKINALLLQCYTCALIKHRKIMICTFQSIAKSNIKYIGYVNNYDKIAIYKNFGNQL